MRITSAIERNILAKYTCVFVLLIALYVIFSVISCWMPDKTVKAHIRSASSSLAKNGNYPRSIIDEKACQQDRFTEALILNVAFCADRSNPFRSAMANDFVMLTLEQPKDLWVITHEGRGEKAPYARYWFGSSYLYRVLLTSVNFTQLQWLLFALSSILMLVFGSLYLPRAGIWKTAAMMMSWVIVYGFMMWFSLQFTPIFIISLAASILIVKFYGNNHKISLLFFVVGSLTCYFDLLTIPLLSFGWPMLVWLSLHDDKPISLQEFGLMALWALLWTACFALTWFMKWVIATVTLDVNIIQDGLNTVFYRTGNDNEANRWDAIRANISMIPWKMFCITLIVLVVCVSFRFKAPIWKNMSLYLLIGIAPYAWYAVLSNHSHIHYWFTYRLQFLTFAAILLAVCSCLDPGDRRRYIRGV